MENPKFQYFSLYLLKLPYTCYFLGIFATFHPFLPSGPLPPSIENHKLITNTLVFRAKFWSRCRYFGVGAIILE